MDKSAAKIAAMRNLLAVARPIHARIGLDISALMEELPARNRRIAREYGAEDCFDKLCNCGCTETVLALAMTVFQPLRSFEKKWKRVTGTPRQREQKIRAMEKAASALQEVLDLGRVHAI